MSSDSPGFELPLRMFLAFRACIDEVHADLAAHGHPDLRPMHGFVFQAITRGGSSAAELGRRLGVSKQAAGKMIETLEGAGYVERVPDPGDARRKIVRLTPRAADVLERSERAFERVRADWSRRLGPGRVRALEDDLRALTPGDPWRLDAPGWFGGA
ncbi:MarR family winged helix-turn-helix transcriptional regulator [Actinomadura sediminis]|uniref:MarR family winged helix-turn-helix transcriptional regulator n=1 Tax=Actinomadura sediminis TaxID=1038904 RepID=A0ABW3F0D4_9ACTN